MISRRKKSEIPKVVTRYQPLNTKKSTAFRQWHYKRQPEIYSNEQVFA
jgi:hypothetical protein